MLAPNARDIRNAVENDIGGAVVLSPFTFGDRMVKVGEKLTEEQVRSIPRDNLRVLKDSEWIHVFNKAAPSRSGDAQAFVIHRGSGKYDVIEGVKINDEPLTKADAELLAGVEPQPAN